MTSAALANAFLLGAMSVGFATAAAFFLRFWRRTRDRFFLFFAAAFTVFALNQLAFFIVADGAAKHDELFVVRLFGFVLILAAIVDKNRSSRA